MTEQSRTSNSRPYVKRRRAEAERATAARIAEAALELHRTVGPARTTVAAVASRAGVTRATVYRHYPDERALFTACSGLWWSRVRPPDPGSWLAHEDPFTRLEVGLRDVYRFYRQGADMLEKVIRDTTSVPQEVVAQRTRAQEEWRSVLLAPFPARRRRTLVAAVAHATEFATWRSLALGSGLGDAAAVGLVSAMVRSAAG